MMRLLNSVLTTKESELDLQFTGAIFKLMIVYFKTVHVCANYYYA